MAILSDINFNIQAAKSLGVKLSPEDMKKIADTTQALLKKNDTLIALADVFSISAEVGKYGEFVLKRVDGTLAQADEIDGKYLQFEGGLSITTSILIGAFKLIDVFNQPILFKAEQIEKFAMYLLSRRSVQTPKGVSLLKNTLNAITEQKHTAPICIKKLESFRNELNSEKVIIQISDIIGNPVDINETLQFSLIIDKLAKNEKTLKSVLKNKIIYEVDLDTLKLEKGNYNLTVRNQQFSQIVAVQVLKTVKVDTCELSILDNESNSILKKLSLTRPNTLTEIISVDVHQKMILKLKLIDEKNGSPITVHQIFVRLSLEGTDEEILFVAEQDSNEVYKLDLDISARSSDFGQKSGNYEAEIILGDFFISNSFVWKFGKLHFNFGQNLDSESPNQNLAYVVLPDIEHKFKTQETRPSQVVSSLFTLICAAPIMLLFIMWIKIGPNVSNFSLSFYSPLFHLCSGSIYFLYGLFWLKLNMFETLKYLAPLVLCTFFFGNRLLKTFALRRIAINK